MKKSFDFGRAKNALTRRDFLKVTSFAAAAGLFARVLPQSVLAQMTYNEAPALADLVASGDLPPIEERLPKNPLVVEPLESIGQYGGQWTGGTAERNPNFYIRNGGYQQLLRWTPEWDGVIPNIAELYDANDAATEFTFHLREGMKYSDGTPLTADDVMFWYEDILMNEELTPVVSGDWQSGGDPVVVEKLDDYTVKFNFTTPYGLFIKVITQTRIDRTTDYPRHYMEQFHIKYNENADQEATDAGFGSWVDRFETMAEPHTNAELPTLRPWNFRTTLGDASNNRVVLERNPYFWKVDTEGNQLPYIDTYAVELATDPEVLLLKALNGELDYQERFISAPTNKAVLFDNKEQGQFDFYELTPTTVNEFIIQLNLTHPDPVKREIFTNKDFRIGLSHAIDRQLIIDVVHVGQGRPWQAAPRPESRFNHEQLATQYTEYNVDLANEFLDKTGWTERDGDGFRIGPDGNRISFIMELDQARTTYLDAMELIKPNWAAVGVEVIVSTMERSLWEERIRSSNIDFDASGHRFGGGSGDAVILDPRYWFPSNDGSSIFAKAWAFWYNGTNPDVAEEPPDAVKHAMELYDEIKVTPGDDKQFELMMQILDIAADEFYAIGTVLEPNAFGVVTNRMRNVASTMPNSWIYPSPAPYNPEQFWVADV